MVKEQLPFSWRTANKLMRIGSDERIADSTHASNLPAAWESLHEITKLPDAIDRATQREPGNRTGANQYDNGKSANSRETTTDETSHKAGTTRDYALRRSGATGRLQSMFRLGTTWSRNYGNRQVGDLPPQPEKAGTGKAGVRNDTSTHQGRGAMRCASPTPDAGHG
jgi:hypothetical protein